MSALTLLKTARQQPQNQSDFTPAQTAAIAGGTGLVGAGGMYAYHRNKYGKLEEDLNKTKDELGQAQQKIDKYKKVTSHLWENRQKERARKNAQIQSLKDKSDMFYDELLDTKKELEATEQYYKNAMSKMRGGVKELIRRHGNEKANLNYQLDKANDRANMFYDELLDTKKELEATNNELGKATKIIGAGKEYHPGFAAMVKNLEAFPEAAHVILKR